MVGGGDGSEHYRWQEEADRLWEGWKWRWEEGVRVGIETCGVKRALVPAGSGAGWEGGSVHGVDACPLLSRRVFPLREEMLT